MATATAQNFEEASAVATESISSLENLPYEVQHILNEIRHLEKKCQELQSETNRDQGRYIKQCLPHRQSLQGLPFSPPTPTLGSENTTINGTSGSNPKAHLPARIAASYAEIDALSEEKIQLAQRLVHLLTRTRSRLDADIAKVRTLQGESLDDIRGPGSANPATQISDSLRHALSGSSAEPLVIALTPPTPVSSHYNKKRRLTTQTSVKLTAPTPANTPTSTAYSRSRPSRQVQTRAHIEEEPEEEIEDLDAEGEEDLDEGEEDRTLYCFCQKRSYGDMIGCDNPNCPYQWFHISCVGVKTPLPDKWYCPACIDKTKGGPEKRKGRKK